MRRCAFLTLDDPTGYVIDDDLAYQPLAELGWRVESVPWRRPAVAWNTYDAVVIRSTCDGQSIGPRCVTVSYSGRRRPRTLEFGGGRWRAYDVGRTICSGRLRVRHRAE
jgi:hypothetical protein